MRTRKLDERRRNTQFMRDMQETLATISRHGLAERGLSVVTQAHCIIFREGGPTFRTYDSQNGVLVVCVISEPQISPFWRDQVERIFGGLARVIYSDQFGTIYSQEA